MVGSVVRVACLLGAHYTCVGSWENYHLYCWLITIGIIGYDRVRQRGG